MLKVVRSGRNASQRTTTALTPTLKLVLLLLLIVVVLVMANIFQGSKQVLLLKAFFVAFLSVLPGWLYLQLPETKVRELYQEYVLNLHRFRIDSIASLPKPPSTSIFWNDWSRAIRRIPGFDPAENLLLKPDPAGNLYNLKFRASTRQDSFSPVLVTTLLLAVGWTLILQPQVNRNILAADAPSIPFPFLPTEALTFGFLGAYTFVLQSTVRRYFQVDLKSRAYINATSRIIIVGALVIILSLLSGQIGFTSSTLSATAFFIGFFPELTFTYMAQVSLSLLKIGAPSIEDRYPLTDLDGFDEFYRFRFREEGIENMQNLATISIPDLILNTKIPIPRLVDWIDQSLLYIRVAGRDRPTFQNNRVALRRFGIRTATDLLDILEETKSLAPELYNALLPVLNVENPSSPSIVESLRWALLSDTNLMPIRHWKGSVRLERSAPLIPVEEPLDSADEKGYSNLDRPKDSRGDDRQIRPSADPAPRIDIG